MVKQSTNLMGMPITVEVIDSTAKPSDAFAVFEYFKYIDEKFSTYKNSSEISQINQGLIKEPYYSEDMKTVLALSEETKQLTQGYFNIVTPEKTYDPSGLVKGWAIFNAANILKQRGFKNFYVEAGGDIEASGVNNEGEVWSVGIKNPFNQSEIVKVVYLKNCGMATSGTYIRGQHIYNPHKIGEVSNENLKNSNYGIYDIASLTVIGPNVYEADRFATAAFAMGKQGINFIENLAGFEGYTIDQNKIATITSGFEKYLEKNAII